MKKEHDLTKMKSRKNPYATQLKQQAALIEDAERFIMLIKHDKFDYTEWQKNLWTDESVESLSEKAQRAWDKG